MNLHFPGGAMEIGGSCIYVRIAGKKILLDCGIRQSASKDPIPDFRTIQEQGGLDAIIISHAHMDHIGTLPIISKAYPQARIYMTAMTADLTRVLLYDSLKIMQYKEDEIPHYSQQDVLDMLGRVFPVGFQTPFPLFEHFTLTFYPAGHIAGAACVYLVTEEGSLFYSGDFSAFAQRTIEGIRIPKLRPDVTIVETTYGNRLHANRLVEEKRLVELVRTCILEKKKILIPAFALGRAQEVLLILRAAIQNQEIPAVPVYVDGMVRDINTMYARNPTYLKHALGKRILKGNEPFYTKEIRPVAPMQNREDLLSGPDPVILLSSSGMLTGGPSAQYAGRLAPMENACIIITGYQDEESPGRQLLNLLEHPKEQTLTINGSTVAVKCRIEQVGLSAHGDRSEIMALLQRLSSRHVFLVHGNKDVVEELGGTLAGEDYRRRIYLPECGQGYEVTLRNKRKQLSFDPADMMQMQRAFTKEDEKTLWDFWQAHYPGKAFSVPQIAQIWYGEPMDPKDDWKPMQELLQDSSYFSPNMHRLFLWEANTPEAVAQALQPKELTIQELEKQVEEVFPEHTYRKISYHNAHKEVLLQFDFPDSQDLDDFKQRAGQFAAKTGWTLQLHPAMNHNAASVLLSMLFGNRLLKMSYYAEKKRYAVTLSGRRGAAGQCPDGTQANPGAAGQCPDGTQANPDAVGQCPDGMQANLCTEGTCAGDVLTDAQAADRFFQTTGWKLLINGKPDDAGAGLSTAGKTDAVSAADGVPDTRNRFLIPSAATEQVEQNLAFCCMDQMFLELPHKPDKKSLKQDAEGKYLELGFLSPALGMWYQDQLQALADQTGWRICIADRVNQIKLFQEAQLLCIRYGIRLAKNPSYLPATRTVQLKTDGQEAEEKRQEMAEEFCRQTGCGCVFQ